MDEKRLEQKLRLIEALYAGATTPGEKVAAGLARKRILHRLKSLEREDPPVEYRFSLGDRWSRKVFVALLRRYGIQPYRYRGQRYTTVMARVSRRFADETLWPQYQEISATLDTYLSDVTDRVVSRVIHGDHSEAEVVEKPLQLPLVTDPVPAPAPAEPPSPGKGGDGKVEREAEGARGQERNGPGAGAARGRKQAGARGARTPEGAGAGKTRKRNNRKKGKRRKRRRRR